MRPDSTRCNSYVLLTDQRVRLLRLQADRVIILGRKVRAPSYLRRERFGWPVGYGNVNDVTETVSYSVFTTLLIGLSQMPFLQILIVKFTGPASPQSA